MVATHFHFWRDDNNEESITMSDPVGVGISISNDNSNIRKNVTEILEQFASHFEQNIHAEVQVDSYSKDTPNISVVSSTTNYIDQEDDRQCERSISPLTRFWMDRLLTISSQAYDDSTDDRADCDEDARCRDDESIPQNDKGIITVLREWILGYEEIVRPRILVISSISNEVVFNDCCTDILTNYEILLSNLLLKFLAIGGINNNNDVSILKSTLRLSLRTINLLSTDLALFVANAKEDSPDVSNRIINEEKTLSRKNQGLQTLLKILGSALAFSQQTIDLLLKSDSDQTDYLYKQVEPECLECMQTCAVTLLAFDTADSSTNDCYLTASSKMPSAVFLPYYLHYLSPQLSTSGGYRNNHLTFVRRIFEYFEMSTSDGGSNSSSVAWRYLNEAVKINTLSYDDIDDDYWEALLTKSGGSTSTAGWIDSDKVILRLVENIWVSMASLLSSLSKHKGQANNKNHAPIDSTTGRDERRSFVIKMLGGPMIIRQVRAHFFGRDLHGMENLAQRSNHREGLSIATQMGRRVSKTNNNPNSDNTDGVPVYERAPSRIVATMNALRLLLVPEMMDEIHEGCSEIILEEAFPICAALLNSKNPLFTALGAAGFLRVIDALDPRKIGSVSRDASDAWTTFADNTLTVLDRSMQVGSDRGHVMVAIGRVQSRLFEVMLFEGNKNKSCEQNRMKKEDTDHHFRRRRLHVTEKWLLSLQRSQYYTTNQRQSLELLLGGVIPLLYQCAVDERCEADGMEVGRLGLAALLPLITRLDTAEQLGGLINGKKTQLASLVALVNLIFAAHPVMVGHGGKIMCSLLSAAAFMTESNSTDECKNENSSIEEISPTIDSIRSMAILIAAFTLEIPNCKFAGQLLDSIENDCLQYEQSLLTVVSDVREVAASLHTIL